MKYKYTRKQVAKEIRNRVKHLDILDYVSVTDSLQYVLLAISEPKKVCERCARGFTCYQHHRYPTPSETIKLEEIEKLDLPYEEEYPWQIDEIEEKLNSIIDWSHQVNAEIRLLKSKAK